jgi:hypothetical protein
MKMNNGVSGIGVFFLPYAVVAITMSALATLPQLRSANEFFISIKSNDQFVMVSYPFVPGCNFLEFDDLREEVVRQVRATWRVADDSCGSINEAGISALGCKEGDHINVRIPAKILSVDRVYPPVVPLLGRGTLVHTSTLAIKHQCGEMALRFQAPRGGHVVAFGKKHKDTVTIKPRESPAIESTYVFFGTESPAMSKSAAVFADDVDSATRALIAETVADVTRIFETHSGHTFQAPALYVSRHDPMPGVGLYHGDVANQKMIRLSLFYEKSKPAISRFQMQKFVAHEFAHGTQAARPVSTDNNDPMVFEGNAELVALLSLLVSNKGNLADVANELDKLLNGCLFKTEKLSWRNVEGRAQGRIPYDCGVAFALASSISKVSSANKSDTALSKLLIKNKSMELDPLAYLVGDQANQVRVMLASHQPIGEWLPQLLTSIVEQPGQATPMSLTQNRMLAERTVKNLLSNDCEKSTKFWMSPDFYEIDASANCRIIKAGMRINALQGVSLITNPLNAAVAANTKCKQKEGISVGLSDGSVVQIATCEYGFSVIPILKVDREKFATAMLY